MKTKLSSQTTRFIYWISALLIAVLTASVYTFTGFASPIARTGSSGVVASSYQVITKEQIFEIAGVSSEPLPASLNITEAPSETAIEPIEENIAVAPAEITSSFISLTEFSNQVANGSGSQITGLYSENSFALTVVQQPSGQAGYVDTSETTTTQFNMAAGLGFLAHNYLAGSSFSSLSFGSTVTVVYGDGSSKNYQVTNIRKLQALDPTSPYSNFVDLATGEQLTASDLFYQTYGVSGQMVLQTCISAEGNSSWGRLFIIATPVN